MKKMLISTFFAGWVCFTSAQSTFEFTTYLHGLNVVPPSTSHANDGTGTFMLSGNSFSYDITTDLIEGWRGKFYGPAGPGINAPPLYDLNRPSHEGPNPPHHSGLSFFRGVVTITDDQVRDLNAGLWYVEIGSTVVPERAIRGQIVPVPEPAVAWLMLGTMLLFSPLWSKHIELAFNGMGLTL